MSKMTDAYGSPFAKGSDLPRPILDTIKAVRYVQLPDFRDPGKLNERLVIALEQFNKDVVVNVPSARLLLDAFGEFERDYIGKKVVLYAQPMNVGGQMREAVMIRMPRNTPTPTPAPTPPPVDPTTAGDFDEEIPFS